MPVVDAVLAAAPQPRHALHALVGVVHLDPIGVLAHLDPVNSPRSGRSWHNAPGVEVARDVDDLHGDDNNLGKETSLDESESQKHSGSSERTG